MTKCPKCGASGDDPCLTGGYAPVGDLPGDPYLHGNKPAWHRQRSAAAAASRVDLTKPPQGAPDVAEPSAGGSGPPSAQPSQARSASHIARTVRRRASSAGAAFVDVAGDVLGSIADNAGDVLDGIGDLFDW